MSVLEASPLQCTAPLRRGSDRAFGFVFAGFFLIVGGAPIVRGGGVRLWAWLLGAVFFALAVVFPRALAWPNRMWLKLGDGLHRLTSPVALALVYLVAFVPAAVVRRWLGHDPLRLRRQPELPSYWISRRPPGRANVRMKLQF